jgi:hypothetical protein
MNNEATAAIRAAVKEFDDRGSFLFKYADTMWDHYAYLPEDPAKRAEHMLEAAEFDLGFADRFKNAQVTLVEQVKAAIAVAPTPDPEPSDDERLWNNFCVSFECGLDRDMEARWQALKIVIDHYQTHLPLDPVLLEKHYRLMSMFAIDYVRKLGHERKELDPNIAQAFGSQPAPWWCG